MESVYNVLVEVIEKVCDEYCKYPEEYSRKFGGMKIRSSMSFAKKNVRAVCLIN